MRPFFASACRTAIAASAIVFLGGCGGTGDGSTVAYSGVIAGYECSDYYMALHLGQSGTRLAKRRGGLACELGPELEGRGCRFFAEEGSEQLRVVLLDCPFDLSEVLFRCQYTHADVDLMNNWTYAGCCFNRNSHDAYCDELPVCFTDEESGASCEDCYNGSDDDADGLVDCEDRSCREVPECAPPTTSTTTLSTTTSSTATTLPAYTCHVRFRLVDTVSAGFVDWHVDYSGAPGEFQHAGDAVSCRSLVDGATPVFVDLPEEGRLEMELTRTPSIDGPAELAECTFLSPAEVEPGGFFVTVIDALTTDLQPIRPLPAISTIDVDCGPSQ
jgi:hypothetical protein